MSELTDQVIAEFRGNGGVIRDALGSHFEGQHLLLLHTVGRRSGRELVHPLVYAEDGDSLDHQPHGRLPEGRADQRTPRRAGTSRW